MLAAYDDCRASPFTGPEQGGGRGHGHLVMAYNARCQLSSQAFAIRPGEGSPLRMLSRHRDDHLGLRW